MKRAILAGIGTYLISFLVVGVLAFLLGISPDATEPSMLLIVIAVSVTLILLILFSLWYFKKVRAHAVEGLKLGIVVSLTGIMIDTMIQAIMHYTTGNPEDIFENYTDVNFWGLNVILIIVAAGVGATRGKVIPNTA